MGCDVIRDTGTTIIVCRGRGTRRRCRWCTRWSTKLCDGPPTKPGRSTCDMPMCDDHAQAIGPNEDLCPDHARPRK